MTAGDALKSALAKVDWNRNATAFIADGAAVDRIAAPGLRLAIWSKQLESADKGNPALPFIRDMQVSGQQVAALAALGLYKPAAYCIRCILESALYYSFFRLHPAELATLALSRGYYIDKGEIIGWHKIHTLRFADREASLGLLANLDQWYRVLSALAHGQIPGRWNIHSSLATISFDKATLDAVTGAFEGTEQVIHALFLCTVAQDLWNGFAVDAKQKLLKGVPGKAKATLTLSV